MSKMSYEEAREDLAYERGEIDDYDVVVTGTFKTKVRVRGCHNTKEARQKVLDGDVELEVTDDDIDFESIEVD